jgi:hypothetical protein
MTFLTAASWWYGICKSEMTRYRLIVILIVSWIYGRNNSRHRLRSNQGKSYARSLSQKACSGVNPAFELLYSIHAELCNVDLIYLMAQENGERYAY